MIEIETLDIKASMTVSRVIRSLIDVVFADDGECDSLNFHDKMFLDDILRYGTLAELSRQSGIKLCTIKTRLQHVLLRLQQKESHLRQMRETIIESSDMISTLKEENKTQKEKLLDVQARLAELEPQLSQLQSELKTKNDELESLRQEKLPRTVEAHQYDNLYAQAQKTIAKQAQEIERLKNRVASKKSNNDRLNQERVAKLKNRIYSLENLIQRYKEQGYEVIKGFE